ncbi:MAG: PGPGW domain-containing protein [Phycisphaerales bacterium]|nr:PGPGW domain-containing protein [Phycisphaerales bacterium]
MTNHDGKSTVENGIDTLLKNARRMIVLVVGGTVVLAGIALLVLPGPAFIVLPAGLAILATEFVWARRMLKKVRDSATDVGKRFKGGSSKGNTK